MDKKLLYVAALFPFAACFLLDGQPQLSAIIYIILIALSSKIMEPVRDELKKEDDDKIGILTWPAIIAILAYMFDCVHNEFKDFDSSTTAYAFILLFIDYLSLNNRYNNLKKKNSK